MTANVLYDARFTYIIECDGIEIVFQVLQSAQSILSAVSAARKAELEAMEMTWDGEVRIVSKYFISVSLTDSFSCIFGFGNFVLMLHMLVKLKMKQSYYGYKNKNWLQFLLIVKAVVLKQQISKFYLQILSTEHSFYIYERPLTKINVIASFCALNSQIKFYICCFRTTAFTIKIN